MVLKLGTYNDFEIRNFIYFLFICQKKTVKNCI